MNAFIVHDERIGKHSELPGYRPDEAGPYYLAAVPASWSPVTVEVFRGDQTGAPGPVEVRIGVGDSTEGYSWEWRMQGAVSWVTGTSLLTSSGAGVVMGGFARVRAYGPPVTNASLVEEQRVFTALLGAEHPWPYMRGNLGRQWQAGHTGSQVIRWALPEGPGFLGYRHVGVVFEGTNILAAILRFVAPDGASYAYPLDFRWGQTSVYGWREGNILQGYYGQDPGPVRANELAGGTLRAAAGMATIKRHREGAWIMADGVANVQIELEAHDMVTKVGTMTISYPRLAVVIERQDTLIEYIELEITAGSAPSGTWELKAFGLGPAWLLSKPGDRGWSYEDSFANALRVSSAGWAQAGGWQTKRSRVVRLPGGLYQPSTLPFVAGSLPAGFRRAEADWLRELYARLEGVRHPVAWVTGVNLSSGIWQAGAPERLMIGRLTKPVSVTQVAGDEGQELWQVSELELRQEVL